MRYGRLSLRPFATSGLSAVPLVRKGAIHIRGEAQHEVQPETLDSYSLVDVPAEDSRDRQVEKVRLLWTRRRFLVRGAGAGLVFSTILAFLIPKLYVSTTQLMPPDSQSASLSSMAMMASMAAKVGGATGGGLSSMVGDLLGVKTTGDLFIGVLKSRTVQNSLVQQFDLRKIYRVRLVEKARLKLDQSTSISEDRKSGIITIAVTDRSPQRAAALAKAYVDELNSLVANLSTSSARREREFLEERLKVVKQGLDDSTNQLAQFSSKNSTLDLETEAKAMLDAAANLEGQLVAAQSELEGLRQVYTDNNSRVQVLKARIAELQKEVGKFTGANQMADGKSNAAPGSTGGIPFPSIRNLPLLGVKYADYYRSAKIQETVYELLTQQYEIAKVQEAKETPTVKVLDAALVPEEKSFPPRAMIIMVGTSAIFVVCVIWILALERWKDVDVRDPRKLFIEEVVETTKLHLRRLSARVLLRN